ncbi:unnamed protein product [Gadus morhua 'NCC']
MESSEVGPFSTGSRRSVGRDDIRVQSPSHSGIHRDQQQEPQRPSRRGLLPLSAPALRTASGRQSVRYSEEEEDTNPVPVWDASDEEEEEEHPSRGPAWIMTEALGGRDGRRATSGLLEKWSSAVHQLIKDKECFRARVAFGDEGEQPPLSLPVDSRSRSLHLRRAVSMSW